MSYEDKSALSLTEDENLQYCFKDELITEIKLFRKALRYCLAQKLDDLCFLDYRHLLPRFLPEYDPAKDDVTLAEDQLKNCELFIRCWQNNKPWACLGGDKGKTIPARSIGTLDCLDA